MIHTALAWVHSLDRQSLCVVIGLGCYALVPFAWANEKANGFIGGLNAIADAIKEKVNK